METITITKRVINAKEVYNKKFDNYDKGFFGGRISRKEYEESKANHISIYTNYDNSLNCVERITYNN